jgi:hypothetical protein
MLLEIVEFGHLFVNRKTNLNTIPILTLLLQIINLYTCFFVNRKTNLNTIPLLTLLLQIINLYTCFFVRSLPSLYFFK